MARKSLFSIWPTEVKGMIRVCSLGSGSNGNAFFIGFQNRSFLVDAGLNRKQLLLRLEQIGGRISDIEGIFITHEHIDHVAGLEVLLKHHPIPVFINRDTSREMPFYLDPGLVRNLEPNQAISFGDVMVKSLSKSHDAANPALFSFEGEGAVVSVITDAGYGCENVISAIRRSDILFMETNYDEEMLRTGFYTPQLKRRVAGKLGHLSNLDAARLVAQHAPSHMKYLFLSHLSQNNNTPRLAMKTMETVLDQREDLKSMKIFLTSRSGVSDIVEFISPEVQESAASLPLYVRQDQIKPV